MRNLRRLVALHIVFVISTQAVRASGNCLAKSSSQDVVLISIEYDLGPTALQMPWIYQSLSPRLRANPAGSFNAPIEIRDSNSKLEILFCAEKNDLPGPEQAMTLDLGPRHYALKARPIDWSGASLSNSAGTKILEGRMTPIVLSDQVKPDWAALRSARLLSSQDGALLLEVIIHNFENSDLPLQEISIGLSHPRSAKIACIREDPRQSVTLEWERIQATEGADGAWTTLGNTKIKVGVAYRNTGECSDYTFAASVPVQQIVPQGGSARISLILRGVGSVSAGANSLEPESLFLGRRKSIPPLQSWLTWRVGASADASIWPKTLLVSRQ